MTEKKVKKTTSSKKKVAVSKKVMKAKKVDKNIVKKTISKSSQSVNTIESQTSLMSWVWFIMAMLFAGLFLGSFYSSTHTGGENLFTGESKIIRSGGQTFVSVKNIDEDFKIELGKENELVVFGGKTWIPVPGNPVEIIILNDKNCKNCNTANGIAMLRQNITPALLIHQIDIASQEGMALIEKFNIATVPQYILAEGIKTFKGGNDKLFVEEAKDILIQKDDLYMINGSRVGFKPGKFIATPKFLDLDTEPVKGRGGKVQVVEFTDYECPFCKRLHDNNKELIDRLVAEGKIEYIVKDFPLDFHAESIPAHKAANCVLTEGGQEKYWEMNSAIFSNGESWQRKGVKVATDYFIGLASDLGVDISTCIEDEALDIEIKNDQEEGQRYGVTGTPALFIGTKIMPGAIDAETFEATVEAVLKNK